MRSNAAFPPFARLPCAVPLHELQDDTSRLLQLENWVPHVNQNDYQGGWDVLPLRCASQHSHSHPVLQAFALETETDWQNLSPLAYSPTLQILLDTLLCPLTSVRLMRLRPSARIKPHRDRGLSVEHGQARLHLPVFTSSEVSFTVDQQTVPMRAGELWYINADLEHAVCNGSSEDRVNLVIDCIANDWLRSRISDSGTVCALTGEDGP